MPHKPSTSIKPEEQHILNVVTHLGGSCKVTDIVDFITKHTPTALEDKVKHNINHAVEHGSLVKKGSSSFYVADAFNQV